MVKADLALEVPDLSGRFAVATGVGLERLGVLPLSHQSHPKER
jgi:hypothetical protein